MITIEQARALAAENERLRDALINLMEMTEPPERDCSCHIAPPCAWCVEYGGVSEAHDDASAALKEPKP